jgi:hypothetical protein
MSAFLMIGSTHGANGNQPAQAVQKPSSQGGSEEVNALNLSHEDLWMALATLRTARYGCGQLIAKLGSGQELVFANDVEAIDYYLLRVERILDASRYEKADLGTPYVKEEA